MNLSRLNRSANHQNIKIFAYYFSQIKSHKKSQNSRNQGFSYYFCLMIQGSGRLKTYGSGSATQAQHNRRNTPKWLFNSRLLFLIYFCYRRIVSESSIRTCGSDGLTSNGSIIISWARIRSPRIDSKEPIPPSCVAWRAGTTTLSYSVASPHRLFKNSSTVLKF